ncbi:Dipeptidyl aminopeptidase/acylaminoacyl-peptidase-like protein [Candidatus Zixiibacteriota bacterium]|nr:Dipeptidyl aminopeptidase/acylaminoacyl-peptidase-like protein [candidate division Zixibacteria bacterium]
MKIRYLILVIIFVLIKSAIAEGPLPDSLRLMYEYNPAESLDFRDTIIKDIDGVKLHDVSYISPKGGRVTAYLVVPPGEGPFAGILFAHWGYGTRTEFLPEAIMYARAGVVSLLVDAPWVRPAPYRRVVPDLANPESDLDKYIQNVIDFRRGIDLFGQLGFVDTSRIVYIGHSYGAQWGAILNAVDKRPKGVILMGGVPSLADIWLKSNDPEMVDLRAGVPKGQLEKYIEVNGQFDAINYVPYGASPQFFQFAQFERYYGEEAMNRLANAACEPKDVKWYNTGHELNDIQALKDRIAWLASVLGIAPIIIQVELPQSPQK